MSFASFILYSRRLLMGAVAGVLAGLAAAVFLVALAWATEARHRHPEILWALPLAGLLIGWVYHRHGRDVAPGNNLILDEIHDPKKIVPLRMAPFILVGTVLTHLFGGSAGREGTAVQMGASLADQLTRYFRLDREQRRRLLAAGAGAGFGAAIGAPWAGALFGMEVLQVGRLKLFAVPESLAASFVGYATVGMLGVHHTLYPTPSIPDFAPLTFLSVLAAGVAFGLAARLFILITHQIERGVSGLVAYPPLRPLLGGVLLAGFFLLEGSDRYQGLGLPFIQEALLAKAEARDPLLKALFTALTVGTGFKGGEFIPLVYVGTTLGSALGWILPASFSLLAAVGFAAVFGAAANTPLACSLMAVEIFGPRVAPFALLGCLVAFVVSPHHGIYRAQRIGRRKPLRPKKAYVRGRSSESDHSRR